MSATRAVDGSSPAVSQRAALWQERLERLGVTPPAAVVHDVGLALTADRQHWRVAGGGDAAYAALIREIAEHPTAAELRRLRLGDAVTSVVLARLLAPARRRQSFLESRLYLLALLDTLDLGMLALYGALGDGAGGIDSVDALYALESPEAHDVADFSLQILPSVLETRTRPSATRHAGGGYAGLARAGSIDSLLPSELAWDDEELLRRLVDDELLYYAHEQARQDTRRRHHLLIDASASMRGSRSVFARGMAIASAKKLVLQGELVSVRFFDSRLYEAHPARPHSLPLSYIMAFKSERGRNPTRVFRELAHLLESEAADAREHLVTIYTHAALHVPREIVARVIGRARVAAVFLLPSAGELSLEYLDLLEQHWLIDDQDLTNPVARKRAALGILHGP